MKPLGPRQEELLGFLRTYVKAYGIAPTVKEMRIALGSKFQGNTYRLLMTLVEKGYVKYTPHRARSLQLVQTKDYHLPDCCCLRCCEARYRADLKLVKALQVPAPIPAGIRLNGLRQLSDADRIGWCVKDYLPAGGAGKRAAIPTGAR